MSHDLDAQILAAHASGDHAALVSLYGAAADISEAAGEIDACCFFLVQAYIFGLETDHALTPGFHARLVKHGRES